ncbi:MAG TPA: methylmalonyl-CoA mutase family protein [Bradyrhizobium sp.]|nr:methylmalonyl-CoA mutase family protein [Bradyrhizobium sp.]
MVSRTYEGIDLQPIYTEEIFPTSGDPFGVPGFSPFVRGAQVLGNSLTGWDIRQEHAAADPAEVNAQILDDLRNNVSSIVLRLDAASSAGYDADDQNAGDLSGRDGVSISTAADLQRALDQVHLDIAGVWLDAGGSFLPAAALYVTSARLAGIEPDRLLGAFNADPLGVLMREGSLPVPLDVALKQMTDLAAWTAAHAPHMTAVEVGASSYHNAGATSAQDLAFLLGTGVEYLRALTAGGLDVNAAAKQIAFSVSIGCRFYQAIAKIRAARMLWAQVVASCGGDAAAQTMRLHATTSRRVMTTRSPALNILRNTAACYAGAIAGADAITTIPFDAPVVLSTESSRRNARNTQLILAEECHLNHVIDPAGGSWYIEWYTRQLAEKAWALFQQIEVQGGMLAAASSGWVAQQIAPVELKRERDIATRKLPITGVSEHPNISEKKLGKEAPNRVELRRAAAQRLANWRKTHAPQPALDLLTGAARRSDVPVGELTARVIAAANVGATLGQLAAALHPQGAEPAHVAPLVVHPFDEIFEELRDASDDFAAGHGHRPRVFLAGVGSIAEQIARKTYAKNFFEAGGFEVLTREAKFDVDSSAAEFAQSGAKIAVICSTDKQYASCVVQLAPKLKQAGARTVILAGNAGASEAAYRAAGVDRFIFVKCDVVDILSSLLRDEGALS